MHDGHTLYQLNHILFRLYFNAFIVSMWVFFLHLFILSVYVCIHMGESVCTCTCSCPKRPKEGIGSSGTEITTGGELPV